MRILDQTPSAQIGQGVVFRERRQTRNATPAHGHDDLAALSNVTDVAAELVVQLADPDLALQVRIM
jgi:hypothetical protein